MDSAATTPGTPSRVPTVGFVSLGCPKALTDSELILTQLRAEGYETSKTFAGADLVIVNTCGFIDDAVKESLDTIGEALAENGKVIVTGCLGAKAGDGGGNLVQQVHPKVLAVTGPHATQEVMDAVHRHVPKPHDPFVDLVPEARAEFRGWPASSSRRALRLPEDQRRLQPPLHLLHHPQHARRPGLAAHRRRAERSARAVRVGREGTAGRQPGHQRLRRRREVPHRLLGRQAGAHAAVRAVRRAGHAGRRARRLGAAALRLSLPACRRDPAADGQRPRAALPGRALPACAPRRAQAHEAPGQRRAQPRTAGWRWREACPEIVVRSTFIAGFPGETEAEFETLLDFMREAQIDRAGCFAYSPVDGAAANELPGQLPQAEREDRRARFMAVAEQVSAARLQRRIGADHAGAGRQRAGAGPQGRSRPQLCRRARDRRHRAAAAAREGVQDPEGGRVHPRPHRGHRGP
jgi:ribosomal protein S12 methylthiotransferase